MLFVKAQTNGNDFVILKKKDYGAGHAVSKVLPEELGDRHLGIGCDQIIIIDEIKDMKYGLEFFNWDGSSAEMCGNGICASALYINRILGNKDKNIVFDVTDREYQTFINDNREITLFVEKPILLEKTPKYQIFSTGNKHLVCDIEMMDAILELRSKHQECNLHFIERTDDFIRMKTFERGVGWTKACGSGAIAVAASQDIKKGRMKIKHDGGASLVEICGEFIGLTVEPKLVFEGNLYEH
jgi:diaminopimelate epimerase